MTPNIAVMISAFNEESSFSKVIMGIAPSSQCLRKK